MKNIVVSVPNALLSDGLCAVLKKEKEFRVFPVSCLDQLADTCTVADADILLAEVRDYAPYRVSDRLELWQKIHDTIPRCKVALVVDEHASQEAARQVRLARSDGLVDAFFYGTVSGDYLTAVLDSL